MRFFELVCPRLLEIIYEINRRFLDDVAHAIPATTDRVARMSLDRGSAGAAGAHGALWPSSARTAPTAWPRSTPSCCRRGSCRTSPSCSPNGSTTRPTASRRGAGCCWPIRRSRALITDAIGDGWITDLGQLRRLLPLADDAAFRERFGKPSARPRQRFADWLQADDRASQSIRTRIFDSQIKRIHEYKRQLLNVLHIVVLYNRLRANPELDVAAAHVLLRRQGGARPIASPS